MDDSNIDYLSGEVREILGKSPSRVSKWALGGILAVLALLVLAGFTFTYSDIVQGEVLLTTKEPPVPVLAPKTGYLHRILVEESDSVALGQELAIFRSDANLEDVNQLAEVVEMLSKFDPAALRSYEPDRTLQLGDLASDYENFLSVFEYLPIAGSSQIDQSAIAALRQLNGQLNTTIASLKTKRTSIEAEIEARQREMNNYNQRYDETRDESYSDKVYEANRKLNEKQTEKNSIEADIQRNLDMIRTNNARILEIELQSASGTESKIFQLRQSLNVLRSAIRRWRQQHVVEAPAAGMVSFYNNLLPNEMLNKDDPLMAIVPLTSQDNFVGHAQIPVAGSGQVSEGQEVNIKFLQYPFRQFGVVKGQVAKIYPLPKADAYTVEISLNNGLQTSTGQTLKFQQQMQGKAEIVTEEQRFIGRLFDKFLAFGD